MLNYSRILSSKIELKITLFKLVRHKNAIPYKKTKILDN
jgi:hypothetical protein